MFVMDVAFFFVAVACTVLGLIIYGAECNNCAGFENFSMTTYVIGFASVGTGGALMLFAMCC